MSGLRRAVSYPAAWLRDIRDAGHLRAELARRDETIARLRNRLARLEREIASLKRSTEDPELADPTPRKETVFFIIGRARCGTTWLRSLLNAHPDILCWGEGRFFERSFEREDYESWGQRNIAPVSLYGAILRAKHLREWVERSVWSAGRSTDEHLDSLTRLAVGHFLATQLEGSGAKIVGDKTPYVSAEVVGEISRVLPDAKVIHIIRDGRDAAVSFMHHIWNNPLSEGGVYDVSAEELALRDAYRGGESVGGIFTAGRLRDFSSAWGREVGRAMDDGRALLGENYVEVRYEDLLEDPEGEARRLFAFLGADVEVEKVRASVEKAGFERGSGRGRGLEDSTSRFRKGIKGDWRNVFTGEDRKIFEEEAGGLLARLGYEDGHEW